MLWPLAFSSQSDETWQTNDDTGLKEAGLLPVAACWQEASWCCTGHGIPFPSRSRVGFVAKLPATPEKVA